MVGYNLVHPAASRVLILSIYPLHHHLRHQLIQHALLSFIYTQNISRRWHCHGNCMQHDITMATVCSICPRRLSNRHSASGREDRGWCDYHGISKSDNHHSWSSFEESFCNHISHLHRLKDTQAGYITILVQGQSTPYWYTFHYQLFLI